MSEVLIAKELAGTPMEGQEKHFVKAGEKHNIDPLFLVAIAHHESKYASAYSSQDNAERHNYAGVMTWDTNGKRRLRRYVSWEEAIYDHARLLREVYLDQGRETVKEIWLVYAPLNESMNNSWGNAVATKYSQLKHLAN